MDLTKPTTLLIVLLTTIQPGCLRPNEHYEPEDLAPMRPDMYEKPECTQSRQAMVSIPHGIFLMGSTTEAAEREPNDQAVLSFMLDPTEVTLKKYRVCVDAGVCTPPATAGGCNWGPTEKDDFPVNCVSYEQATQYCSFLCARLPTEIEWEYAARGENSRAYPWGDEPPGRSSKSALCLLNTNCKVAQYVSTLMGSPSVPGLYDMAGNVWEWTTSAWPCKYPLDRKDPSCGLMTPTERVVRGGYVYSLSESSRRSAYRHHLPQASQTAYVGFRCARTL